MTLYVEITNSASIHKLRSMIERLEALIRSNNPHGVFEIHMHSLQFADTISIFLFKSWIEQLHIMYPLVAFKGLYGTNHPNLAYFEKIGIFIVIEPSMKVAPEDIPTIANTEFQNYSSNKDMKASHFEPTAAQNVAELFLPCCDQNEALIDEIHSAINEALLNATDWAYERLELPKPEQNWWLTGICDKKEKNINILVYDQGSGLPHHFAKTRLVEVEKLATDLHLPAKPSDASVIEAAIEFGKQQYRPYIADGAGRGLRQMRELTEKFRVGKFLISSGYGVLQHEMVNGKLQRQEVTEQGFRIPGTLLCWLLEY